MGPGLGYHGPRNTKEEEEETMAHYVTGPAIKALRERKGLTQKQLAEQILVSDKAVSKWEKGGAHSEKGDCCAGMVSSGGTGLHRGSAE